MEQVSPTRHDRLNTPNRICVKSFLAALLLTPLWLCRKNRALAALYFFSIFIMAHPPSSSSAHDLLPADIAATIPALGASSEHLDPIIRVKWFTPDANWTWYVAEFNPESRIGYGLVYGLEREWGTFSLTEIEQVRGSLGLPVERDLFFMPIPVSELTGFS